MDRPPVRSSLGLLGLSVLALHACSEDPQRSCPDLFGRPNENTGLDEATCAPECPCTADPFSPAAKDVAQIDLLASTTHLNPPELLSSNPYDEPDPPAPDPTAVCTVGSEPGTPSAYRTATVPAGMVTEDAVVTHTGPCGMCSSLQDLSVYMRYDDLTGPVRQCGVKALSQGSEAVRQCLRDLGFSEPCVDIWFYNSTNTRQLCLIECLEALEEPYHTADGSLNACLQCDEDNSGPVFKAFAGRTRRNSGLPSAICRPCSTVSVVHHDYSLLDL